MGFASVARRIRRHVRLRAEQSPYISKPVIEALEPQIRDWEPRLALDGGDDGLDCYRQIASQCGALLKADGFLCSGTGRGTIRRRAVAIRSEGWNVEPPVHDLAGIERVLVATFNRMNTLLDDTTVSLIRGVWPRDLSDGNDLRLWAGIATDAAAVARLY
jgi:hypothetical protein